MKQTIFFIIFNIPVLIFCQTQNNQCKILINDFDLGINVNTFFVEKIIKEDSNLYATEYGTTINATEAFKKYEETSNVSKSNLTEKDIEKEFYFEDDEKINIAQLYSIIRYTEDDKLVCYQNIWFPKFKILATNDDKFVALIAENRKVVEEDFKQLIENLEKNNKLNAIDSENFETYSFDFESYYLKLRKVKPSYRTESSVQILGKPKEKIKIDLEFIILSKSANEKHLNWLNKNYGK
ncbi:hypothetical protein [Xanthomarina gelatinilytica]|uniref:hypothetical protein n=1 Tax=Xanthomarina gelatinilytica TaxID=1137281 RepID=UPI003AA8FA5B